MQACCRLPHDRAPWQSSSRPHSLEHRRLQLLRAVGVRGPAPHGVQQQAVLCGAGRGGWRHATLRGVAEDTAAACMTQQEQENAAAACSEHAHPRGGAAARRGPCRMWPPSGGALPPSARGPAPPAGAPVQRCRPSAPKPGRCSAGEGGREEERRACGDTERGHGGKSRLPTASASLPASSGQGKRPRSPSGRGGTAPRPASTGPLLPAPAGSARRARRAPPARGVGGVCKGLGL